MKERIISSLPEKVNINGLIVWVEYGEDGAAERPGSVTVRLKADGEETTISKDSLDNNFEYEEGEDGKYYEKVEE